MNKAMMNYWADVGIGVSFIASAISGLVFLLPGDSTATMLGIGYQAWNSLHTWSSLVLIAGVGAHLALHWRWMASMTKRLLSPTQRQRVPQPQAAPEPVQNEHRNGVMSRRAFLALSGTTAVAAGLLVAGKAVFGADAAGAEESAVAEDSAQSMGVACPKGLVYDPYPGKCRHYVDTTGDGFCDYSVPN
jgi:hypothetical protein